MNDRYEELPGFVPTREELILLAKYWMCDELGISWFQFITGDRSGGELRRMMHGSDRLCVIKGLLGDKAIEELYSEVLEEFRCEKDQQLWEIFLHGDEDAWCKISDEQRLERANERKQEEAGIVVDDGPNRTE